MTRLAPLLNVWKKRWARLLLGLTLAELSICSAFLLMGQTGSRLGAATASGAVGFALLRWAGSSRILLRYFERLATHDATFRVLADIRVWFYRRLAQGAAAGLGFRRSGDLLSRLVSDVQSLDSLYLRILVPILTAFVSLPIVIWLVVKNSIPLAISIAVLFIITAFLLPFLAARIAYRWGPDLQTAQAELNNQALDLTTGLRELRIFNREATAKEKLFASEDTFYRLQHRQGMAMAHIHAVSLFLTKLGVICVLAACAGIVFPRPQAVMGMTILFVVMTALDNIVDLPRAGLILGQVRHAAERVSEATMVSQTSHKDGQNSAPEGYEIEFKNVSFGWTDERPVLNDISLRLREGERAALIGPSGVGKSSLAALLLKVATPQRGSITLGGGNISSMRTDAVRGRIAWLSQASHLFDDTIRANLLLGRTNISDDEMWSALEQAQIADFVRSLPEGLDAWIGENGSKISGGQGRRIALARVLLSKAPVLVLDEPGTGLDLETEKAFLKTLNGLEQSRTILLITHRLLGVEQLDHLWTLKDGSLASHRL